MGTGKIPDFATVNESASDSVPLSTVFMLNNAQDAQPVKDNKFGDIESLIDDLIEEDKENDSYGLEEEGKFLNTLDSQQLHKSMTRRRKKLKSRVVQAVNDRDK